MKNRDLQKLITEPLTVKIKIKTYRVRQITFFLENALKKLLNISSNFFFYFKVQSFRLEKENNFIQMAASASHAVAYTIGPFLSVLSIACSCISPKASRILCPLKRQLFLACRRYTYL